jgi:predicted nucleic acid-binding protein
VTDAVLVDTNVFSALLRPHSQLTVLYAKHLFGNRITVTPQTLAELRYGALKAGWGESRLKAVERLIVRARALPVDADTIRTVAELRNECRLAGHGLHQRAHNADLWIAATAIRWNLRLVAHDGVFVGCPRLDLRTELVA